MEEVKISTANPSATDSLLQQLGACAIVQLPDGTYDKDSDGNYTLRIFSNAGYIKFAIKNQGYATIVE